MHFEISEKELKRMRRYNSKYKENFPCVECGKEIEFRYYEPTERVFCDKCKKGHKDKHKKTVEQYTRLKLEIMHENALRQMEKSQNCYLNDMLDSISFVREMEIENPESFLSIPEIITAIILVDSGIDFKINYKVLNYKVDFYIPSKFVCLEVDGDLHNYRLAKDGKRDIEIRNELGAEWETIRIPTKLANENPNKIVDAIDSIYKEIKRIRKINNGVIPSSFSRTARAYYKEIGLENNF